ncbi:MAG: phytanoyl-CoA dioxygenase family protein [Planctomycetes bacterium]|nr:phytanoyl-CoA dioxygenase family protein [Planctomycetota bacterium]
MSQPASRPAPIPTRSQRQGDDYLVSAADRRAYAERGYITLEHVLREDEVQAIEAIYDRFSSGAITGMGRDLCDMSGTYDMAFNDYALVNAMLPRIYLPSLQGNCFERISASISRQLLGEDMTLDYDQFLSKKPNCPRAAFAMHQDMGYWPVGTPDTRTATCSLAITDSLLANGCIQFIPGTHLARRLFPHRPKGADAGTADRSTSHTLEMELPAGAEVVHQEVRRGSITVHDEWVVHGSGGNGSDQWRKTYVIAYRSQATVAYERSIGFTHSHNDRVNWKTALDLV